MCDWWIDEQPYPGPYFELSYIYQGTNSDGIRLKFPDKSENFEVRVEAKYPRYRMGDMYVAHGEPVGIITAMAYDGTGVYELVLQPYG